MLWGEERLRCKLHLQHFQVDGRHVKLSDEQMRHCLRLTCQVLFSWSRLHHKESLSETEADCLHNLNPFWKLPSSTFRMPSSQQQVLFCYICITFLCLSIYQRNVMQIWPLHTKEMWQRNVMPICASLYQRNVAKKCDANMASLYQRNVAKKCDANMPLYTKEMCKYMISHHALRLTRARHVVFTR